MATPVPWPTITVMDVLPSALSRQGVYETEGVTWMCFGVMCLLPEQGINETE